MFGEYEGMVWSYSATVANNNGGNDVLYFRIYKKLQENWYSFVFDWYVYEVEVTRSWSGSIYQRPPEGYMFPFCETVNSLEEANKLMNTQLEKWCQTKRI